MISRRLRTTLELTTWEPTIGERFIVRYQYQGLGAKPMLESLCISAESVKDLLEIFTEKRSRVRQIVVEEYGPDWQEL